MFLLQNQVFFEVTSKWPAAMAWYAVNKPLDDLGSNWMNLVQFLGIGNTLFLQPSSMSDI